MRLIPLLLILMAASAFASPPSEQASDTATMDVTNGTGLIARVSHLIDLWHDANLKADGSMILRRSDQIVKLLRTDIRDQQLRVDKMRVRLTSLEENSKGTPPTLKEQQLLEKLARADDFLKVKKRLLGAFSRTRYFSNKYRLLGDYVDILQLEQDRRRPAMADNEAPYNDPENK